MKNCKVIFPSTASIFDINCELPLTEKSYVKPSSPYGAAKVSGEADGLHARVIQHEFDHLNGILYTSRLADKRAFGYSEEIEKFWKKNDEE